MGMVQESPKRSRVQLQPPSAGRAERGRMEEHMPSRGSRSASSPPVSATAKGREARPKWATQGRIRYSFRTLSRTPPPSRLRQNTEPGKNTSLRPNILSKMAADGEKKAKGFAQDSMDLVTAKETSLFATKESSIPSEDSQGPRSYDSAPEIITCWERSSVMLGQENSNDASALQSSETISDDRGNIALCEIVTHWERSSDEAEDEASE